MAASPFERNSFGSKGFGARMFRLDGRRAVGVRKPSSLTWSRVVMLPARAAKTALARGEAHSPRRRKPRKHRAWVLTRSASDGSSRAIPGDSFWRRLVFLTLAELKYNLFQIICSGLSELELKLPVDLS